MDDLYIKIKPDNSLTIDEYTFVLETFQSSDLLKYDYYDNGFGLYLSDTHTLEILDHGIRKLIFTISSDEIELIKQWIKSVARFKNYTNSNEIVINNIDKFVKIRIYYSESKNPNTYKGYCFEIEVYGNNYILQFSCYLDLDLNDFNKLASFFDIQSE